MITKCFEKLRFHVFWLIDFLKGSKVKKHYSDITYILENYSSLRAVSKRKAYLNNILNHASATTPFYANKKKYKSLSDFKVVNKNIIQKNENQFISASFVEKKNKLVLTSGSTGVSLKVFKDLNKVNRNTADTFYFSEKSGFKVGYKLIYIRLWDKFLKKHPFISWIQNVKPINVLELNNTFVLNLMQELKKDTSTKAMLGYASAFEQICKILDKQNAMPIKANVKSIIAMSESLNDYTKKSMEKYFNAPVVSRYSNMENGIIALQRPYSGSDFHINWASYYVEVLKFDSDDPSENGDLGRIIVTDLFNYSMPLIRYDTGDIGSLDESVTPPVFKKIEGRKMDMILNTKGKTVSSFIIMNALAFKGVLQSQLIQESKKDYLLKLNITNEFKEETKIVEAFKLNLGCDAQIKVEYVKEIPLLSSGKRKVTINNYLNKLHV